MGVFPYFITMDQLYRFFYITGVILVIVCLLWHFGIGREWIGHLPGDIIIRKSNILIYIPLGTSAAGGLVLTLLLWILRK